MTTDETQIRALADEWAKALRSKDIDGVMSHYTPDIVIFGITPPLQYSRTRAHREHWEEMFASFKGPIGYEIRDHIITTAGDIGFGHCINRVSGTMQNGQTGGTWMRVTLGYRKIDGRWKVTHEHVSVPLDTTTGKAAVDLEP